MLCNNSRRVLAVNCCQAVHLIYFGKSSVRPYNFLSFAVRLKKSSLVSGNGLGEHFLSAIRPLNRVCIRIHIFNFKKQTAEKKEPKKAKETKEERITSPENWLKQIKLRSPEWRFFLSPAFPETRVLFIWPNPMFSMLTVNVYLRSG